MSTVVGIHPLQRDLARIWEMNTDVKGNTVIDAAFMQQIIPLIKRNYELVRQLDELKQLSFLAYVMEDYGWLQDIVQRIEELEQELEI
ncbi:hypothetical protein J40TS1_00050 [Paenibacillus montaniterrae]|uniref:Uncharacterized protein n=1 Tax=Paenibacillus montaniterrae TaxID=429341 RepID=A0A920CWL6_9BACL|nr:hypothetical protein [Paenibacillus montaniterrae]GIP14363.1 hypothetical protein J40TS1_00050 [Paenibacillus montaniterrae]